MSASLLFPTIHQSQVKNRATYHHRHLLAIAAMYRTVFGVVPMDTGHSTPGPALLQSPSVGHIPPETIQDSDGAVTQPLPVSWSSRHPGSKARQLYDAEWENLQPLLHILYIKEIRTLAATRKALRERYGFNLRYLSCFISSK